MQKWILVTLVVTAAALVSTLLFAGFSRLTDPPIVIHDEPKFSNSVDFAADEHNLDDQEIDHTIADDFGFRPRRPEPDGEIIVVENPHEKYIVRTTVPKAPKFSSPKIELFELESSVPFCHGHSRAPFSPFRSGKVKKSGSCRFTLKLTQQGLFDGITSIECSDDVFKTVSVKNIKTMFENEKREGCVPKHSKITYRLLDEDGKIIPE